jgi:uncharacterized membrane protein
MKNNLFSILLASSSITDFFTGITLFMIFRVTIIFFSALFVAYGLSLLHVPVPYFTMVWATMVIEIGIDLYRSTVYVSNKTDDDTKNTIKDAIKDALREINEDN